MRHPIAGKPRGIGALRASAGMGLVTRRAAWEEEYGVNSAGARLHTEE
jgi:hypothetical protein